MRTTEGISQYISFQLRLYQSRERALTWTEANSKQYLLKRLKSALEGTKFTNLSPTEGEEILAIAEKTMQQIRYLFTIVRHNFPL